MIICFVDHFVEKGQIVLPSFKLGLNLAIKQIEILQFDQEIDKFVKN